MNEILVIITLLAVIIGMGTLIIMRGKQAPAHEPAAAEHTSSAFISGVVFVGVSLILTVLLTAAYTTYEVQASQQKWCTTLDLLTSHSVPKPADPALNPSREQTYVLYSDFVQLKGQLGCGPP